VRSAERLSPGRADDEIDELVHRERKRETEARQIFGDGERRRRRRRLGDWVRLSISLLPLIPQSQRGHHGHLPSF
jgi:hypothetical protein